MRQKLELFANIRPVQNITKGSKNFRCVVLRENTEGLYCGLDFKGVPEDLRSIVTHKNINKSGYDNVGMSIRIVTQFGLERIIRFAFEYAVKNNYEKVTFAEKPNVLRSSGQFSCDIFNNIASEYPSIKADIHNVDAIALWLVKKPEKFGVIVGENMYGDILSDLAAGIMGGLGVAPSANIGNNKCYFEPVHGSAPSMAGKNIANPAAMFLTISLMLDHLGYKEISERIKEAVTLVISSNKNLTYDFGGNASTEKMSDEIIFKFNKIKIDDDYN